VAFFRNTAEIVPGHFGRLACPARIQPVRRLLSLLEDVPNDRTDPHPVSD
jgi:hypothetical protein